MAAAGAPPGNGQLQQMLQAAVQDVQWTYSLFWQFCPQQGVLVWSDGYYNGAIKTRKTVQPMEVSAEEASLQRSQQLRELYDSLSVGDARRPSAALSPEDLTETEWFYLMCVSFSFPPAVGLPGKAYIKRQHVWLTGAHEVDSKVFSRAILAKSARVQTVVCIPLMDGVVELGSTERLQEDPSLVQQVKTFFVDHLHRLPPPKPALSEHSTSNPTASRFHSPPFPMYAAANPAAISNIHQVNEDEDDDDNESDSEGETGRNSRPMSGASDQNPPNQAHLGRDREPSNSAVAEPSELMQLEMSEDIRLGSPEDASNNMDPDFPVGGDVVTAGGSNIPANAMVGQQRRADSFSRAESSRRWPVIQHDSLLQQQPLPPLFSGAPPLEEEESAAEDTHYSQTVSSILQYQAGRWSSEASPGTTMGGGYLRLATPHSAFSKWPARADHHVHIPEEHSSQWLLKYILFTVPFLHTNNSPKSQEPGPVDPASRLRAKGAPNDELSANHVLAERRRREKLNERFIILRSLVPFVTKMDKASILGDTIEYVKQLRRKIQDLEARAGQIETERVRLVEAAAKSNSSSGLTVAERAHCGGATDKRKVRVVESSTPLQPAHADMLQVSIIESDALIELQCPYREGLLLDVMVLLREMRVEVTAVQSSMNNGFFTAELRAKVKVKENVNGKKASIVEVKRAINQIVPHSDDL